MFLLPPPGAVRHAGFPQERVVGWVCLCVSLLGSAVDLLSFSQPPLAIPRGSRGGMCPLCAPSRPGPQLASCPHWMSGGFEQQDSPLLVSACCWLVLMPTLHFPG